MQLAERHRCYPPPSQTPSTEGSNFMNSEQIAKSVGQLWDDSIVPTLQRYIRIPNQSPLFDPDWKKNQYMDQAVALARTWVEEQQIPGLRIETHELSGR